jgi:ubiquinone/menaquinone biosynthesis C-methylase UbiE
VIHGIPDFRLRDDPYISIEADREKAARLVDASRTRSLEALIDYYYSITPDDPPDLALRWKAHALADVQIARFLMDDAGMLEGRSPAGALLDIGCSTGGLLVAADRRWGVVGVDIALRWLVVGQVRLRDAGVRAPLICASADRLPFADATFQLVTCIDVLEHVADAEGALREAHRVSGPGASILITANNRYAPLREPQLGIWGVGCLPRTWQAAYVAWRRPDLNRYSIRLRSASELDRMLTEAGYRSVRTDPAALTAPHRPNRMLQRGLAAYNAARTWPIIRLCLRLVGPRLRTRGQH